MHQMFSSISIFEVLVMKRDDRPGKKQVKDPLLFFVPTMRSLEKAGVMGNGGRGEVGNFKMSTNRMLRNREAFYT